MVSAARSFLICGHWSYVPCPSQTGRKEFPLCSLYHIPIVPKFPTAIIPVNIVHLRHQTWISANELAILSLKQHSNPQQAFTCEYMQGHICIPDRTAETCCFTAAVQPETATWPRVSGLLWSSPHSWHWRAGWWFPPRVISSTADDRHQLTA